MNFEDLREYEMGDNVKDIDWKASARTNKILIKQYIAEKKHNILFILDSGKKMLSDTKKLESKKEVALMTVGTIGYLVCKNGDSIGAIYKSKNNIKLFPFKVGLYNLENILTFYEKEIREENNINEIINYVLKFIKRKMIIFIITDIEGINNISEKNLKKLSLLHDVMFVNISDALISNENSYDIEQDSYIPKYILNDKKLRKIEIELKNKMCNKVEEKFKKYKLITIKIDEQKNIVKNILELLERRKNADIN